MLGLSSYELFLVGTAACVLVWRLAVVDYKVGVMYREHQQHQVVREQLLGLEFRVTRLENRTTAKAG